MDSIHLGHYERDLNTTRYDENEKSLEGIVGISAYLLDIILPLVITPF